jgi:hypothetical protein
MLGIAASHHVPGAVDRVTMGAERARGVDSDMLAAVDRGYV